MSYQDVNKLQKLSIRQDLKSYLKEKKKEYKYNMNETKTNGSWS